MADVTRIPGVWEQVRLVAGLRWRILLNSLRKKNNQWDLIGTTIASIFGAGLIIGLSIAFFLGSYQLLSIGRGRWIALLFWAIFINWQLMPIFTAGFGAGFEFRNMLRFPLTLRTFYVISLAYGLAGFSAIASICWLIAMSLGAAATNPSVLAPMLVVCFLFALMNITLERMIGSWLERILARRRSREIFFALFILLAVSAQFISPLLQGYGRFSQSWTDYVIPYLTVLPPSLAAQAVAGAASHHFNETLVGAGGIAVYGLLFSLLLWIRFSRQYRGEELSETPAPARVLVRRASNYAVQADALRLLSPQVAAVLRKEFRYLIRNSFSFFLLILPLLFVLLFATQFSGRHPTALKHPLSPELFFPGMMGYLILILMGPAYNCFAFDGKGIQVYFTSPLSFREVFLGKNLLHVAMSFFELAISIAALSYFVGLPSPPVLFATLAAIIFVIAGQLAVANWSSLTFPRKLNFGQMRGQRQSGMAALVSFATQILLGGISAPVLFTSRWTGNPWLATELFSFLATGAIVGYFSSLEPLAHLAENKKETLIEALCR